MTDHHHDWRPSIREHDPHEWQCSECSETSATCSVCSGASGGSLLICESCLSRQRALLASIERFMTMPGSDRGTRSPMGKFSIVSGRGGGGGGSSETAEERLLGWVARWSEHMPNPGLSAIDYLNAHLIWAVHNQEASRWPDYLADAPRIRGAARAESGLAPERHRQRCMHCGGHVVQDRHDKRENPYADGLQDVVRCTGCAMTWGDRSAFQRNVKQHIHELPANHPHRLVTLDQARLIFPDVPTDAWRKWAHRDRVDHARSIAECDAWDDKWTAWEESGQIGPIPAPPEIRELQLPPFMSPDGKRCYRLGDMLAMAERRAAEDRPGRRASALAS